MAELERLMPQSFRRLLELQAFVEKYGRGDVACMDQLLSLQVNFIESVLFAFYAPIAKCGA